MKVVAIHAIHDNLAGNFEATGEYLADGTAKVRALSRVTPPGMVEDFPEEFANSLIELGAARLPEAHEVQIAALAERGAQ